MHNIHIIQIIMLIILSGLPMIEHVTAHDMDTIPGELYFSAANCVPVNRFAFNSGRNGNNGFRWAEINNRFGWWNFDNDDREEVVCPIPYERLAFLNDPVGYEIRVAVWNNSNNTQDTLQVCSVIQTPRGDVTSEQCRSLGPTIEGFRTLILSVIPRNETRWIFIRIRVPPWRGNRARTLPSGIIGYRVCRIDNCG